jgi:hypothetical protein
MATRWYLRLVTPNLAPYAGRWRSWMGAAPLASLIGVFAALKTAAAYDVREAPLYLAMYFLLGAAWIFCAIGVMPLFGVSFRDDAVERRNPAAAIVLISAMASHAIIYSGANIGDGPGWWVVVITGLLSGTTWFMLWWIIEAFCSVSERVTVERDLSLAIRLGGYMLASAIMLARGAAGDWVSFAETLRDFVVVWPAVVLAGTAIAVERLLRASPGRTGLVLSLCIAAAYVVVAAFAVVNSPPLSQNPVYDAATPVSP